MHALTTLQIQRLYDQLAQHARKDGKPGGLGPRTIREMHLCLRQALGYAMKWHDPPANPATDAEPPAIPTYTRAALTPEQVGMLLAAAHHDRRPWLCAFTILAAATGARRIGELCGPEWHDPDLDAVTLRFRHALSSVDQQLATGQPRPDGTRGTLLAVGPLKTPASQAVLSLPGFAVDALRAYQQEHEQRSRAPLRLPLAQPRQAPGRSSSTCCCATPTAARWQVEPTSTSFPRPHPLAGDLTVAALSPRRSRRIPTWSRSTLVTCANGLSIASAVARRPVRSSSSRAAQRRAERRRSESLPPADQSSAPMLQAA